MGNGYNHHQKLHLHHKSTFLPMLCSRTSIKDVALPKLEDRSMSFSSDPLSPKIGCMGQVKRHNNKIVGFPTSNKITITRSDTSTPVVKYSKLKRIFSAKNSFTATTATSVPNTTSSCRRRGVILNGVRGPKIDHSKENSVYIRIEDMDPPLPVIKKVHKPAADGEVDTLWKRRSGGAALKNLQLQQIQLNRHNLAPTTV
ncbi:hypothetical protein P3X46_021325 [Hevea brasiliensis]|uniref:Uncharacterized protein n=1 Tax=Hevea brasiliensis TaxID=3981 RepID=A0ABQ9LJ35_HEVBR|nr:uncharacterized protein LOC110647150 [Hevea brasiliensis]KAJ9166599.1 hypothetical protein P3X46_021325 [Hevea brasiliensis]